MSGNAKNTRATIIPAIRYRESAKMVDWLCEAFGFEKQMVVPGQAGAITHAQLVFGNGMIMIGSMTDTAYGLMFRQPDEIGGVGTQSPYIIVDDADAHYARAKAAGADIKIDIKDEDYGGRGYTCADPEGHFWSFGTYDPWESGKD